MNFNFPLLGPIRILLFPFSLIYILIVFLRNRLYDANVFKSHSYNLPIICIGNIAAGGTGKSPMVEYLVRTLKNDYQVATLSRGYKRKTTGYALAGNNTTALEIGDEPMQFHIKFPEVAIAVGEERTEAIPQILHDRPGTNVIILDDAFQHRKVKAGLNIILTDYNNLYTRDWYLPTGDLRDEKSSVSRAQIIVVTKCKPELSEIEKQAIIEELGAAEDQRVFFTSISYGTPYHLVTKDPALVDQSMEVLLVTGIANPKPLKALLQETTTYYEMSYNDHHIFTIDDLKDIVRRFEAITAGNKLILTTEKDSVRLIKFEQELRNLPVFVLPIQQNFLFDGAKEFNLLITNFINDGFRSTRLAKSDA